MLPPTYSTRKGKQAQANFTLAQRSVLEHLASFFLKQSKSYPKQFIFQGDLFDKPTFAHNKKKEAINVKGNLPKAGRQHFLNILI